MIDGKPLAIETILDIGIQVAGVLDAAHRKGIIHRTSSRQSIFVSSGLAKILDVGLAKYAVDAVGRVTGIAAAFRDLQTST